MNRIFHCTIAAMLLAAPIGVSAQSAGSGVVGQPASTNAQQIAGRDASGNLRVPKVDSSGNLSATVDCAGAACALAPQTYQLLTNASASGATVANIAGGGYFVDISGTFGGTTATLQYTDSSGAWQTSGTCTAYCTMAVPIGQGSSVRMLLTGGTPSAMNATLRGVGGPFLSMPTPLPIIAGGTNYTDVSVASLSSGQAAGTTAVLAADASRHVFAITPASDGRIYIATSASAGFYIPIYAGVTRILSGPDCPTNDIFVTGQTVATPLLMSKG